MSATIERGNATIHRTLQPITVESFEWTALQTQAAILGLNTTRCWPFTGLEKLASRFDFKATHIMPANPGFRIVHGGEINGVFTAAVSASVLAWAIDKETCKVTPVTFEGPTDFLGAIQQPDGSLVNWLNDFASIEEFVELKGGCR